MQWTKYMLRLVEQPTDKEDVFPPENPDVSFLSFDPSEGWAGNISFVTARGRRWR